MRARRGIGRGGMGRAALLRPLRVQLLRAKGSHALLCLLMLDEPRVRYSATLCARVTRILV